MKIINSWVDHIAKLMYSISGVFLIAMMMIIIADVISRAVFGMTKGKVDFTFLGGVELVSYSLLFMILFCLPFAVNKSQVIVDLFTENMSEALKDILSNVYTLGFGLLGLGMSIRFYESIFRVAESGETTQDLLIPMSYIYSVTFIATTILAVRSFLVAFNGLFNSGDAS